MVLLHGVAACQSGDLEAQDQCKPSLSLLLHDHPGEYHASAFMRSFRVFHYNL